MASVAANTPVSTPKTPFERTMESLNLPKQDINTLIMDFLVKEGYPAAARRFAEEANIEIKEDDTFINERVQIREAIYQGNITAAMEEINEINPELLDKDRSLNFSLHRLQLIEKIKAIFSGPETSKQELVTEAIHYAQEHLSPYTERNVQFKTDLERAMALLIVPREAWQNWRSKSEQQNAFGALAELVDPSLRVEVAQDVNSAILKQQSKSAQTHIRRLLSTRAWSEEMAREKGIILPDSMDLGLGTTAPVPQQSSQSSNGHTDGAGDTQMTEGGEDATGSSDPVARYTNIP